MEAAALVFIGWLLGYCAFLDYPDATVTSFLERDDYAVTTMLNIPNIPPFFIVKVRHATR